LGLALGHLGDPRLVEDLRTGEGFVTIPADSYPIGDKKTPFRLTHSLQMSKYLVTNSQYALFLREGGYQQPTWWSDEGWKWLVSRNREQPRLWTDSRWNGPNQPVVGVSYYEAEAFARWAGCRLPTANESEAAARGPQGLEYPWGNDWKDGICNSAEAQLGQTSTVGLFAGSRSRDFGLEDCAGNVWEWCDEQVGGVSRVYRGGSWGYHARSVRCAVRGRYPAVSQDGNLGFRLVRVQES
jgi:formylglycine-generating enzyme required for sulfatase activity